MIDRIADNNIPPAGNPPPVQEPASQQTRLAPQPSLDDWRQLLRALVRNNVELPEFAGRDHEDPEVFLRGCLESFEVNQTEEHARVRLASRSLKDDATRWWAVYSNLNISWTKFCELLRNRYALRNVVMCLSASYSGKASARVPGYF